MGERITWTHGDYSETGRAGGIRLFSVGYGVQRQDDMYYLRTDLPVESPLIGQHYPTPTHAKVAAERLLAAFIERISTPRATPAGSERADDGAGSERE